MDTVCPVAGLECMTTGSAVSALPYLATQVDIIIFIRPFFSFALVRGKPI